MRRIGIVFWSKGDGVAILHSQIVQRLGYEVENFFGDQKLPECLDLILLFGPWGSMLPLTNQLIAIPPEQRPRLVWWLSEQLPNPALPEWLRYGGGWLRTHLERLVVRAMPGRQLEAARQVGKVPGIQGDTLPLLWRPAVAEARGNFDLRGAGIGIIEACAGQTRFQDLFPTHSQQFSRVGCRPEAGARYPGAVDWQGRHPPAPAPAGAGRG